MAKGRMYGSRGDGQTWPRIDYFHVYGTNGDRAVMGESLATSQTPLIKFRVSTNSDRPQRMTLLLIRGGQLLKTFDTDLPIEVEYADEEAPRGKLTFYRIMDAGKHLFSNPVFVKFKP